MRRSSARLGTLGLLIGTALASCSADTGDFRSEAESFLRGPLVARRTGQTFATAECAAPPSTKVDTQFHCSATTEAGVVWDFNLVIDGTNTFRVTDYNQRA